VPTDEQEASLTVGPPADHAAGLEAVRLTLARAVRQMGVVKTTRNLRALNQADGFDCMSCAWPDPQGHRHTAEFCENGAKAVSWEGDRATVGPEFFAAHSLADLAGQTDHWLEKQGRLVHPMVRREGGTHYEPISWGDSFALIGAHLTALDDPDEAIFYTSGRTSNEAAFVYQLFARAYGTNNLPDCSNMCHESTGGGPGPHDRHRQGLGVARGPARGRPDHRLRAEPGHQPSAHADRAGDRQARRRPDPGDQPAARGRADAL
jgi:anaerobic selenocysteine-containing dehydrogenase